MAMVTAFLPKGYCASVKEQFIAALGDVECIGFHMPRIYEHVYLHEFDPDHCDEVMRKTKYLVIYTGAGKITSAKHSIAELFHNKCVEIFGPEDTLYTSVIIEEHTNEMISCEGCMRCEDPEAVAAQLAYQKE